MLVQTKPSTKASRQSLATTDCSTHQGMLVPGQVSLTRCRSWWLLIQGLRGQICSRCFLNLSGYFQNHVTTLDIQLESILVLKASAWAFLVWCCFQLWKYLLPFLCSSRALPTSCTLVRFLYKKRNEKPFRGTNIQASYKGLKRKKESMATKLIHKHIPNWLSIKYPATLSQDEHEMSEIQEVRFDFKHHGVKVVGRHEIPKHG